MVSTNGGLSFYNLNDSIFYVLKVIFSDLRVISNIIDLYKSSGRGATIRSVNRVQTRGVAESYTVRGKSYNSPPQSRLDCILFPVIFIPFEALTPSYIAHLLQEAVGIMMRLLVFDIVYSRFYMFCAQCETIVSASPSLEMGKI